VPRSSHVVAVGLVFYDLNLFTASLWLLPLIFVLMIGWVNAFNFMDGIKRNNGFVCANGHCEFSLLSINESSLPLLFMSILFRFGHLMSEKKANFAGDVGSISMAVFFGYFCDKTMNRLETIFFSFRFTVLMPLSPSLFG
jgi:UDP-N-acetylmuramyl pentapeptide phosphotransferase/UDP-N-acetylglucosamine-1-phosphate transferase